MMKILKLFLLLSLTLIAAVFGILIWIILSLILIPAGFGILIWAVLLQWKRPISEIYRRRSLESDFCPLNHIPERLRYFVLEIEDEDFFSHPGYYIEMIIITFVKNLRERKILYGSSTITQQLVKNLYFRFSRSYFRKLAELIIVLRAEKVLDKQKILELYFNTIYYGNERYGIVDAARFYFNIEPDQLTENQMFLLATLISAPTAANPLKHPEVFIRLRDKRLGQLLNKGAFSEADVKRLSVYSAPLLDPQLRACDAEKEHGIDSEKLINNNTRFGPNSKWS